MPKMGIYLVLAAPNHKFMNFGFDGAVEIRYTITIESLFFGRNIKCPNNRNSAPVGG
jgi:hypothetical protein